MPNFSYRVRDRDGNLITGEIEAVSANELKEALFQEGMIPLDVREIGVGSLSMKSLGTFMGRVRPDELMIFTRQFATLFKAGVSMDTILSTTMKQTSSRMLKNTLVRIRSDVASGSTLGQAFGRHPLIFNELYVSMLSAGEEAGILEEVLKNLSNLIEKEFEIQKSIKSATLYPKIVITVLCIAIVFLMTFVVPKFADFYGRYGASLPVPTRILMGISGFFRNYWYLAATAVVFVIVAYKRFYRTNTGKMKIDKLKFEVPVFGQLHLKVANARFGHILSALYTSGLAMPRSLEVVSTVIGNAAFSLEVQKARDEIQKGSTLSEALAHQTYFPPVIVETTAVGESAGALGEMLATIAEHYDLEVNHTIKNLTTLLEPLLLVGIFAMVALLALAIFLPIWNMSSVISGRG